MNTFRSQFIAICTLFVAAFALPVPVIAQRHFNVSITVTNQNQPLITWPVQSATPVGDLLLLPQFQVKGSPDLTNWTNIGVPMTGMLHQTLSAVDSNSSANFYRVQSIISEEYAQLDNAKLASSDLDGADFFGASLFGAQLDNSSLRGADLSGADLRNASLTEVDFTGSDFFGVEAAGAVFDNSSLNNSDASFADFEQRQPVQRRFDRCES